MLKRHAVPLAVSIHGPAAQQLPQAVSAEVETKWRQGKSHCKVDTGGRQGSHRCAADLQRRAFTGWVGRGEVGSTGRVFACM